MSGQSAGKDQFREALEAACLEGLISTEHGYRYRPATGADAVLALLRERLTSDDMASHIQNWVPLGYDYPRKDPYPDTYQAARAILAELASVLVTRPGATS